MPPMQNIQQQPRSNLWMDHQQVVENEVDPFASPDEWTSISFDKEDWGRTTAEDRHIEKQVVMTGTRILPLPPPPRRTSNVRRSNSSTSQPQQPLFDDAFQSPQKPKRSQSFMEASMISPTSVLDPAWNLSPASTKRCPPSPSSSSSLLQVIQPEMITADGFLVTAESSAASSLSDSEERKTTKRRSSTTRNSATSSTTAAAIKVTVESKHELPPKSKSSSSRRSQRRLDTSISSIDFNATPDKPSSSRRSPQGQQQSLDSSLSSLEFNPEKPSSQPRGMRSSSRGRSHRSNSRSRSSGNGNGNDNNSSGADLDFWTACEKPSSQRSQRSTSLDDSLGSFDFDGTTNNKHHKPSTSSSSSRRSNLRSHLSDPSSSSRRSQRSLDSGTNNNDNSSSRNSRRDSGTTHHRRDSSSGTHGKPPTSSRSIKNSEEEDEVGPFPYSALNNEDHHPKPPISRRRSSRSMRSSSPSNKPKTLGHFLSNEKNPEDDDAEEDDVENRSSQQQQQPKDSSVRSERSHTSRRSTTKDKPPSSSSFSSSSSRREKLKKQPSLRKFLGSAGMKKEPTLRKFLDNVSDDDLSLSVDDKETGTCTEDETLDDSDDKSAFKVSNHSTESSILDTNKTATLSESETNVAIMVSSNKAKKKTTTTSRRQANDGFLSPVTTRGSSKPPLAAVVTRTPKTSNVGIVHDGSSSSNNNNNNEVNAPPLVGRGDGHRPGWALREEFKASPPPQNKPKLPKTLPMTMDISTSIHTMENDWDWEKEDHTVVADVNHGDENDVHHHHNDDGFLSPIAHKKPSVLIGTSRKMPPMMMLSPKQVDQSPKAGVRKETATTTHNGTSRRPSGWELREEFKASPPPTVKAKVVLPHQGDINTSIHTTSKDWDWEQNNRSMATSDESSSCFGFGVPIVHQNNASTPVSASPSRRPPRAQHRHSDPTTGLGSSSGGATLSRDAIHRKSLATTAGTGVTTATSSSIRGADRTVPCTFRKVDGTYTFRSKSGEQRKRVQSSQRKNAVRDSLFSVLDQLDEEPEDPFSTSGFK